LDDQGSIKPTEHGTLLLVLAADCGIFAVLKICEDSTRA